ncbi:MAG: single-stranded DNA-binding protein [Oribacterium sp.]|nr:single-stranded DNA-binding protein [Oribacterium sp.]
MASRNHVVVGGVVSDVREAQVQGRSSKITIQTPVLKQDGTPGSRFTTFDFFGNAATYPVGSCVLVSGVYNQSTGADQNGEKRDFRSLVANRIQFTGSKQAPVVFPVLEAEVAGNIASDLRTVGQNGGVGYSVAINSYKKPANPGEQGTETTAFVNVVDFTGASNAFVKGQPVYLKGTFSQGSYTNQQGVKVYTLDFTVTRVVNAVPAFQPSVKAAAPQAPATPAAPQVPQGLPQATGFVQPPAAPVAPAVPQAPQGFNIPAAPQMAPQAPVAPAPAAPQVPQGFNIPATPQMAPAAPQVPQGFNIPAAPQMAPAAPAAPQMAPAAPVAPAPAAPQAPQGFTIPNIQGMGGMPLPNMAN